MSKGKSASAKGAKTGSNTENGIEALDVNFNGTKLSYQKINGKYYNVTDGTPEELPAGVSFKTLISNAEKNGAEVKRLTPDDVKKKMKAHSEYRKMMDDFLNRTYARNKGADQVNKAYRNSKRAGRIAKRGR